jgi:MFS family permease
MAAGAMILISSPAVWGTVPAAFVMGLCGALLLVTSEALLSDRHGEWKAVALSESNITASACAIAAPLLVGTFAASGLGWRFAFVAPVVALAMLAFLSYSEPMGGPTRAAEDEVRPRARDLPPRYWALWTLVALGVASEWCVAYWGADFLAGGRTSPARERRRHSPCSSPRCSRGGWRVAAWRASCPRRRSSPPPSAVALAGFPLFWLSAGTTLTLAGLLLTWSRHRKRLPAGRLGRPRRGAGKHRRRRREAGGRRGRRGAAGPVRAGSPRRPGRYRIGLRHRTPDAPGRRRARSNRGPAQSPLSLRHACVSVRT